MVHPLNNALCYIIKLSVNFNACLLKIKFVLNGKDTFCYASFKQTATLWCRKPHWPQNCSIRHYVLQPPLPYTQINQSDNVFSALAQCY